jgi:hypothetical protein
VRRANSSDVKPMGLAATIVKWASPSPLVATAFSSDAGSDSTPRKQQITALINPVPTVLSQVTPACPVFP